MGKTLIITEKPSVARDYAKILKVNGPRAEGLIEDQQYCITWCVGHLVEMLYPDAYDASYKKWNLESLPFLPQEYKYDVIANVKRQYEIVSKCLHRTDIDTVLWAGDSGKEGQVIEENIRRFGGVREGMEERRVWIDSCTEEEILRGIREAKPMSEYDNLANSGIMRSIEDYAVGINFSRALSVRYGQMLNQASGTKNYTAIAIGRVMTCVLGMVVKREREIRNFKETFFYKIQGDFSDYHVVAEWKVTEDSTMFASPKLYKDNGFVNREDAEQFISALQGKSVILQNLEKSKTTSKAPLLFNLAELQAECAKRYKISPDQTLQVAQNLYEKKLTTYPRTDARVLSSAIAKEISRNLYGLKKYDPTLPYTETILQKGLHKNIANTQYTDDKKVTDHYAIIPTGNLSEHENLSALEKSVYDMIVRRFLSIFYPPAVYDKISFEAVVEKEHFYASAKALQSPGYLEVVGKDKPKDDNRSDDEKAEKEQEANNGVALQQLFANAKPGDILPVHEYRLKEGKTQPPKRYTSGSMVLAMENAGQLIEEEELRAQIKGSGIGTSATRAEIIAKLVNIGYLNLNKKSQVLSPERFGEMVYEIVAMTIPALLEPKMTASWEKGLDGITNGTVDMNEYRQKLEAFIAKETIQIKEHDLTADLAERIEPFADNAFDVRVEKHDLGVKCPLCGGEVETTPFGYGCKNYAKDGTGCKFSIGKIAGKRLGESTVKKLITEGKTDVMSGFLSKTGVPFRAALRLKDENGVKSIAFDFSDVKPDVVEDVVCPVCGGKIYKTSYGFSCENRNRDGSGCYFQLGKIASRDITADNLKDLLKNGKTGILKGFVSQKGKKFEAGLELVEKDGKKEITFYFEDNSPKEVEGVKCPECGGKILKTFYGYTCENRTYERKDRPENALSDNAPWEEQNVFEENGEKNLAPAEPSEEELPEANEAGHNGTQGCHFSIGKIASKDLSVKDVTSLLTKGKTDVIIGFRSKAGKRFNAKLKLVKEENGTANIAFDFEDVAPETLKDVVCPNCGGKMNILQNGFGCENYKPDKTGCNFFLGKIAGKMLTKKDAIALLANGKTDVLNGFKSSKTKKSFSAGLVLRTCVDGTTEVAFDFENENIGVVQGAKCPVCAGPIVKTSFGFGCKNYAKDGTGCNFSIGTIGGKKLSEAVVKKLLTEKQTEEIEGFTSKSGKKFAAALKLEEEKDENGKPNKKIVFVFPERPKPVESSLVCPKCRKKLFKNEWNYSCECGYKVRFTVAQRVLSEDEIRQMLENGMSAPLDGFVSKTGNTFQASLKLEEDGNITFVFDRPAEPQAFYPENLSDNMEHIEEKKDE